MKVKDHYENLLTKLEEWTDLLAQQGPAALDNVMGQMHDAVGGYLDDVRELHPYMSVREKLQQVKDQLTKELGHEPTAETVASEMNMSDKVDVVERMLAL